MMITFFRVRTEKLSNSPIELVFWGSDQAESVAKLLNSVVIPITLPRDYDPDYFDQMTNAANISDVIFRAGEAVAAAHLSP